MRRCLRLTCLPLLCLSAHLHAGEARPIFDGRSFAGWEGDTNATWRIESGALTAGSLAKRQARNDFLATTREYGDFDLSLKWKLEGTEGFVNGGVQFRTKRIPNHHEVSGNQADLGAGYDGALYDESRRNKILAKPDADTLARARKPLGEWNDYRIRAEGPRIRIWLNGVPTVDYTEADPAIPRTGIIAVQIHGAATLRVAYKDIVIEELDAEPAPAPAGGTSLINGRDLDGWTGPAREFWKAEDGCLVYSGAGGGQPADHWLASERRFENFEATFEARTEGHVGTGLFFRSDTPPGQRILGWQCDVGQGYDGGLFKEGPNGGMVAYPSRDLVNKTARPGEWNTYRVRAEGPRLRTWVNGVAMADHTEKPGAGRRREGRFALEISGRTTGTARFRNLVVTELPSSPEPAAAAEGPAARITPVLPAARPDSSFTAGRFTLGTNEVVVFTGSENMVLEQGHGALEARLTAAWKDAAPRFRHMGWEGDTVHRQNRMMEWGSWAENLRAVDASVVVAWFGQLEAMDETRGVAEFRQAYARLLDEFARQTRRVVVIGPPPFEKPADPRVPDNTWRNARVREFSEAARALAAERGLVFVDLTGPLSEPRTGGPYTRDGMHFAGTGLDLVAEIIARGLGAESAPSEAVRRAVVEKNRLWFDTWRCMNWAFAYGDRDTQPFARGADGFPPFVEELKKYQPRLAHAEATVRAALTGGPAPAAPPPEPARADPPALSPEEQMARFKVRDGFAANLFADEKLGVVRPLQIRWDERGRLWVACTPSYPQLQPGEHARDHILILEDTDGDGRADKSSRFAEGLTMPMGFEFAPREAGGGLYVCEATQLVHLADRDRNDQAEERRLILSGFGTGDTHQNANSLRWGPDGHLWFTQGYHIWSYVETPHGLAELNRSGVWRFNPRTLRLDSFLNESTAGLNCWGTAWDDAGQIFHGSGADTAIWHTTPALIPTLHPRPLPTALAKSRGKSMEPEILGSSHLPDDLRGALLKSTYFTSQVQLYRLRDAGSGFTSEELGDLMSGENEFRPVETRAGADGALYVCDWLNPVIGHYQASYRDPRRDRSHGRVWRVTAKGRALLPRPALAGASAAALVERLDSPERWVRDTAKHLLYRMPAGEVLPAADAALATATDARRYELSGVLAAHEAPRPALVDALLASTDFRYRAWALRLTGVWADRLPDPLARVRRGVEDDHPRVRLEAVVAAAWMPAALAPEALVLATRALDQPVDAPIEHALVQCIHALERHWRPALAAGRLDFGGRTHALARVLSTVGDKNLAGQVRTLLEDSNLSGTARESLLAVLVEHGTPADAALAAAQAPEAVVVQEALVAAARRRTDDQLAPVITTLLDSPQAAARLTGLRMITASGRAPGAAERVRGTAENNSAPAAEREEAVRAFARVSGAGAAEWLKARQGDADPTVAAAAVAGLAPLEPAAAGRAAAAALARATSPELAGPWLRAVLAHQQASAQLGESLTATPPAPDAARHALRWLGENGFDAPAVRKALLAAAGAERGMPAHADETVRALVSAARTRGDAVRGETVFKAPATTCLACHRVGEAGGALGPDLTAIGRAMTPEAIVESVLWPKRQVKEGYLLTQVTTRDGRSLQGYRAAEDAQSLTLRELGGAALPPIAKADIRERNDTGTLMPEGLLNTLDEQQRLDLLAYLLRLGR